MRFPASEVVSYTLSRVGLRTCSLKTAAYATLRVSHFLFSESAASLFPSPSVSGMCWMRSPDPPDPHTGEARTGGASSKGARQYCEMDLIVPVLRGVVASAVPRPCDWITDFMP